MSAKHTPGPWYVRKVNGPEHDPERFRPAVNKMGRSVPPTLGNARLIAAAPELLEFAEEVRRTGDTRLASMAIAVIAKATGAAS